VQGKFWLSPTFKLWLNELTESCMCAIRTTISCPHCTIKWMNSIGSPWSHCRVNSFRKIHSIYRATRFSRSKSSHHVSQCQGTQAHSIFPVNTKENRMQNMCNYGDTKYIDSTVSNEFRIQCSLNWWIGVGCIRDTTSKLLYTWYTGWESCVAYFRWPNAGECACLVFSCGSPSRFGQKLCLILRVIQRNP